MSENISLEDAYAYAESALKAGQLDEAELMTNRILAHTRRDGRANRIMGGIAIAKGVPSLARTHLLNALRVNSEDIVSKSMIANAVAIMNKVETDDKIFVVGDSHSIVFGGIKECVLRWVGPSTMHRVGKDGISFLNFGDLGVREQHSVVVVFGEIDVRQHLVRLATQPGASLDLLVDDLVARYLTTVRSAATAARIRRCVIAGLPPPILQKTRWGTDTGYKDVRVAATDAINIRLRFSCRLFGFGYLDQFSHFALEDGTMPMDCTADGLHLHGRYRPLLAAELRRALGL